MLTACAPLPAALVGDNESFESIPGGQEGASISDRKDRNVEKEFIPVVDTDKISYDVLANENAALLTRITEAMAAGATAAVVEKWARLRFAASTTVDLVIGAAHYIERCQAEEDTANDDVPTSRHSCEWCGGRVEIGADYKRCLNCGRHQ